MRRRGGRHGEDPNRRVVGRAGVAENAEVSNPYAPPEDRSRDAAPGDGTQAPAPSGAPGAVPAGTPGAAPTGAPADPASSRAGAPDGTPYTGPAGVPRRSPTGVPYERVRGAAGPGPAPHPTDVHRLAVRVRTTALLVLVAVLADLLTFPWYLAAAPVALAALVVGGRALAIAARTGQRGSPRAVLGLLLVVAVLSLARPGVALVTWDAESTYAECQAGALTVQAQNSCVADYQRALNERADQLTNRMP